MEGNYKHELHTEADLGLDIDLISMDCDNDAEVSNFNEVDEKLLEDEVSTIKFFSSYQNTLLLCLYLDVEISIKQIFRLYTNFHTSIKR